MSVEALSIVLHHSRARGTTKLVLVGIANHDGDGGSFPKVATLAKYCNVHPRRVMEALNTLGALGEVVIHEKDGGTHRTPAHLRPNRYELALTCPPECDRTKNHRIDGEHLGRGYKGQYDPEKSKDPARVARGKAGHERRLEDLAAIEAATVPASAENGTSAENVTGPSAENVTGPSAENNTTKNHQLEPSRESRFGSTSPGTPAPVDNSPAIDVDAVRRLREASRARLAARGLVLEPLDLASPNNKEKSGS